MMPSMFNRREMVHSLGGGLGLLALADLLQAFKKNSVNLTWIESFPLRGPEKGYLFFLDFEGHAADAKVKKTISELESKADRIEVLGSYPRSEPVS